MLAKIQFLFLSKAFNNITDDIELDNLIDKLTKKFNNKITTDNHIELYNTFINKYDKQSNKITNNNSVINKKKDVVEFLIKYKVNCDIKDS